MKPFSFASVPQIDFGPGKISALFKRVSSAGSTFALITGKRTLERLESAASVVAKMRESEIRIEHFTIAREPSPQRVDEIVSELRDVSVDGVIAIGGGSVIDAGKAVSAMIGKDESVREYLEGVGHCKHDGSKLSFIAVPTTSGTGSEATKNAVLSEVGSDGFKKSLRHDNFVPDVAIVDPELTLSCPPDLTACCGMDAFVQLLEAYVSTKASAMTDALAFSALRALAGAFPEVCESRRHDIHARTALSYASLQSGICLASAGLGVVHGAASAIGGMFDIPHGVVCGTLIAPASRMTIAKLERTDHAALEKYAKVGRLLCGDDSLSRRDACKRLVDTLTSWTETLRIPTLGQYGIQTSVLSAITGKTGNKNSPGPLEPQEINALLTERI